MNDNWREDMEKWIYAAVGRYVCETRNDENTTPELLLKKVELCLGYFVDSLLNDCESPLEAMLFAYFLFGNDGFNALIYDPFPGQNPIPEFGTLFRMQEKLGRHRVDFIFEAHAFGRVRRLAIECDGHDFHDRTKEQAQRDKSRDRELLMKGVTVIRYTGSEIFRDAHKCYMEVEMLLVDLIQEAAREAGKKV